MIFKGFSAILCKYICIIEIGVENWKGFLLCLAISE